jgi:SAM-dependent methyltransferase
VRALVMNRQDRSGEINAAIASLIGRPATVLEVGAGSGIHGMLAKNAGAKVTGIESDPELAARASVLLDEVLELDPENAHALENALGDRRFDLVLVPDLIEKSSRPAELLANVARFVGPEGRLIASVRNKESWPLRFGIASSEIGFDSERTYYSREELGRFVEKTGLTLIHTEHNPMLMKAARRVLEESTYLSAKDGESVPTGYRDLSAYQMYLQFVRPVELAITRLAPRLLAYQHVIVARRPPKSGRLDITVGMLTMDEEPSVASMIDEIRRYVPDAKLLCVDSSVKDQTPVIAERMGARVLRQLPPRGHGPAMELLMYEAAKQSDALIYLDCDFTYPPAILPTIRNILESGVDLVNAARTRDKPDAMPMPNYIANKTFVYCSRLMNGVPVADLHSGMRGYRSSLIKAFAFSGEGDALPIDTLIWPARSGYHVVEVPIEYQERVGVSKLRKLAGTVWTMIRLGKTLGVGARRDDTYEVWSSLDHR